MQSEQGAVSRALVLGGGGPLGVSWEAGMLQGWAESWAAHGEGLGLFLKSRLIGTSAGAIVAAHLAVHGSVTALMAQQHGAPEAGMPKARDLLGFFLAYLKARLLTRSVSSQRRSMGHSAIRAAMPGEDEFTAAIARSYAPAGAWPVQPELLLSVVDADTGEVQSWSAERGIPLALGIAASCAMPCVFPLVHAGGHRYMDGGIGSPTNAWLAAGCDQVVVLDAMGRIMGNGAPLHAERRALEETGSHTLAFAPDEAVASVIGRRVFDMSRSAEVARLGRLQGLATGRGVWNFLENASLAAGKLS